jgi:hypothetical protein
MLTLATTVVAIISGYTLAAGRNWFEVLRVCHWQKNIDCWKARFKSALKPTVGSHVGSEVSIAQIEATTGMLGHDAERVFVWVHSVSEHRF